MPNSMVTLLPTADQLLAAPDIEVERALLRHMVDVAQDPMRRWTTCSAVITELFNLFTQSVPYDYGKKAQVEKAINRAWHALERAELIEEPDIANGKNGYRVVSVKGRAANADLDFVAAKVRSAFTRDMFHTSLPDAAWNAFRVGDYDTAVFESFKAVESAVRKKCNQRRPGALTAVDCGDGLITKALNPQNGPLTDMAAPESRRKARCNLFRGTLGELRNPKAHGDPTIADPLIAVEEMMTAGALLRIVENL